MATKKEVDICIELVGGAAKRNYARSQVLSSIIVAQACLESGYMTSELAEMKLIFVSLQIESVWTN